MKIRKLLAVALTATLLCGSVNVNAYAAEVNTAETVTDVESTEESTNEDTAAEDITTEENVETTEESVGTAETVEETSKEEAEATEEVAEEATEESKKETKKEDKKEEQKTKAVSYSKADLRLLSSLIFCEAGSEPYAGKLAVGIVVMNRVESKKFPGTLKNVIYQKYQFGPARNGSLSRALTNYDNNKFTTENHKECIKAAKAALSGTKKVTYKGKTINMSNMLYFSGRVSGAKLTIANHQFK